MITDMERLDDGVKIVVSTPTGQKLAKAKRLLVSVQPTRENLEPFDVDEKETLHFSKPKYGQSQTGPVTHSKLHGFSFQNVPAGASSNAPFLQPPFVIALSNRPPTNIFSVVASGHGTPLIRLQPRPSHKMPSKRWRPRERSRIWRVRSSSRLHGKSTALVGSVSVLRA